MKSSVIEQVVEEREIAGLISAMQFFKFNKGKIITANQRDRIFHGDYEIEVMPAYEFLINNNIS